MGQIVRLTVIVGPALLNTAQELMSERREVQIKTEI